MTDKFTVVQGGDPEPDPIDLSKMLGPDTPSSYERTWLEMLIKQVETRVMDADLEGALRILRVMKEDFCNE